MKNIFVFFVSILLIMAFTKMAFSTQTTTIVVDGNPSDWLSLKPAYSDPKGDCECSQDYDIKAIFTAIDSNYAYLMVETYGMPINKSANLEINFDYKRGQHFGHGPLDDLGTNSQGSNIYARVDINLDGKSEDYPIEGYSVVRGDVLEARIPLSEIGNPSYFNVTFLNIWNGNSSCDLSEDIPSPLTIDYVLKISEPSTGKAVVTMNVSDISNPTLEIEEHGYHGLYVNILSLSASDINGTPLPVEHIPDSGTSWFNGQLTDVWRINCAGLSQIRVKYTVQPNLTDPLHGLRGYIGPDFAISAGEYVFLVPKDLTPSSVGVSFDLPTGWNTYTPWVQENGVYNPAIPKTDIISSLSTSSFTLGNFDVYTHTMGDTKVAVTAYHKWPTGVKETFARRCWDVFTYQTSVFGDSVGNDYLAIFCPPTSSGESIYSGEWSTSQGYSIDISYENSYAQHWYVFAHQTFHRWNGWAWGFLGPQWFGEGPNVFYEMKSMAKLEIPTGWSPENELESYYSTYLSDYIGTADDKPLTDRDIDTFITYRKSAMVSFLIAKEIYLRTSGQKTFNDYLKALFNKYGYQTSSFTETILMAELNSLTGTDFTQFFNDYVSGTAVLPMSWAFQDDDGDGFLNCSEIFCDTNPIDSSSTPQTADTKIFGFADIKADGLSGTVNYTAGSAVSIEVKLCPSDYSATDADWWVMEATPSGNFNHYDLSKGSMIPGLLPTHQGPLFNLGTTTIFKHIRFISRHPHFLFWG